MALFVLTRSMGTHVTVSTATMEHSARTVCMMNDCVDIEHLNDIAHFVSNVNSKLKKI